MCTFTTINSLRVFFANCSFLHMYILWQVRRNSLPRKDGTISSPKIFSIDGVLTLLYRNNEFLGYLFHQTVPKHPRWTLCSLQPPCIHSASTHIVLWAHESFLTWLPTAVQRSVYCLWDAEIVQKVSDATIMGHESHRRKHKKPSMLFDVKQGGLFHSPAVEFQPTSSWSVWKPSAGVQTEGNISPPLERKV